jgi:site-specific DNA-cytosine methylase
MLKIASYIFANRKEMFHENVTAPCRRHGTCCKCCTFDLDGGTGSAMTMVVAGSVCHAWSAQGAREGAVHESFVAFLIFIVELVEMHPTAFVHECTPFFKCELMKVFLGDMYHLMVLDKESPEAYGWPARRPRQYVVGVSISKATPDEYFEMFSHTMELRGDSFMTDDNRHIRKEAFSFARDSSRRTRGGPTRIQHGYQKHSTYVLCVWVPSLGQKGVS